MSKVLNLTAQTSCESAVYFLENLRFTTKSAEIELKQTTFSLR